MNFILDLLFPIQCLGCGQEENFTPRLLEKNNGQNIYSAKKGAGFICPACFEKIPLDPKIIYFKQSPLIGLMTVSSYKHPLLKEAIRRYKYDFVKGLAKPLAQLLVIGMRGSPPFWGAAPHSSFLLVPVPLHQKRLRWRGFNQAELLAQEISQALNIPLINNVLKRVRHGLAQAQIKNSQEREKNVKEAFALGALGSDPYEGLTLTTIILIDDISTTGATLKECARVLKKAGAQKIWGLVLAKG
ncbi:MAG: hypothetical protein A3I88_02745 [Candidatus Portnoybacteria bacterium RIFCSPLOWO2_12_FULL_39_9]|uniref:Phosphoribosyltransferase domain-containing protein n=1 Tax=Candidatus Portnoybacteria bacterium RIFCSPHIGHO2_12_FULL_38_9 TaxID=1801997 RepID=A0A1G2FE73_9BACT|nr:MAG: hypothetical protein A3J64_01780 [Candidatus Portnoybacteria bacterium RIFCSPHIGHO2_12_FULL_38_9]OGZ36835.1 MAG: hypothetical protein A2646_03810 [Candidatus Portnoybacteria bacterium RIFCSPHIGHO2_02_FULL_39_12]OGZ38362.1 MAG: hypothetical protein A3F21_00330 [Candidatus Portnoybacteria bacterium RIFCSPLOWO2_01_FULL_38_39]OGZ40155.1 MAG: hypothetical protein A3I88_02745 [Candidatus Portnoybacteria bacterium RIFCSPLOWO2_12_FULL_39_9]